MHTFGWPIAGLVLCCRHTLKLSIFLIMPGSCIAPCFNIHSSICSGRTSPTSTCLLRYRSNLTYSVKNSLIPQRIQCSLLVCAMVPCIDFHSLNRYLSSPAKRQTPGNQRWSPASLSSYLSRGIGGRSRRPPVMSRALSQLICWNP